MFRLSKNTIQSRLFINYSTIIVMIVLLFTVSFYIYTSSILKKQASESIYQLSSYISTQFDTEIRNMDMISIKIINSRSIIDNFKEFTTNTSEAGSLKSQRGINNVIYSIMGPWLSVSQINIFSLNGRFMCTGNHTTIATIPTSQIDKISWLTDTIDKKGHMYISIPHMDDWQNIKKNVISLCRTFSERIGGDVLGIVEIQQDYTIFSDIIKKALTKPDALLNKDKQVIIFTSKGAPVYPLKSKTDHDTNMIWYQINQNMGKSQTFLFSTPDGTRNMVAYTSSSYTGFIFALIQSEKSLLKPVASFRNSILLAGIGVLLMTMLISYFMARRLTNPIKRIHQSIKNLRLGKLPPMPSTISSGFNELEDLNLAFQEMCLRLEKSLDEAVKSHSQEIQARMLAFQSQMNPHFLYNTLSVISITSEKGRQYDVVKMCEGLSDMLRYIASDAPGLVTIADELEHTQNYLNLMERRYPGQFLCISDLPEEMKSIHVPKLILQPVIENCFKYAISVTPPWKINILGSISAGTWRIEISDNGPGFSEAILSSIKIGADKSFDSKSKSKENLEGLGLVNIHTRLSLLYRNDAVFEMKNNPSGGAVVVIGGFILKEDADSEQQEI